MINSNYFKLNFSAMNLKCVEKKSTKNLFFGKKKVFKAFKIMSLIHFNVAFLEKLSQENFACCVLIEVFKWKWKSFRFFFVISSLLSLPCFSNINSNFLLSTHFHIIQIKPAEKKVLRRRFTQLPSREKVSSSFSFFLLR